MLVLIPKSPRFSKEELNRLSSICADVAQVLFATIVIPFIFRLATMSLPVVLLALEVSIWFWIISLWFSRKESEI